MNKIKKNDNVVVIKGKDKGKKGKIMYMSDDGKAVVENINKAIKHQKGNPSRGISSGIIEKNMPIQISNLAIVNPVTGKADKIGFRILADGNKVRYFKSNNELVDI